jgi:hypothetical protein
MLDAASAGPDISAICRVHGIVAVERLVQILGGPDAAASVDAARVLLSYGYGLPVQPISIDADGIHIELDTSAEASEPHRANGRDSTLWTAR